MFTTMIMKSFRDSRAPYWKQLITLLNERMREGELSCEGEIEEVGWVQEREEGDDVLLVACGGRREVSRRQGEHFSVLIDGDVV